MRRTISLVVVSAAAAAALLLAPALLTAPGTDWLARVRSQLERREYHASRNQTGLQAPNRAQNLRTYFETTGIRVHDRTAPGAPELLALSLAGVGRGDALAALPPGEITSRESRVEIRRDGLVEWYENSAAGLEQGFTLAERPAGDGPLVIELALRGAAASMRDEAVILSATSGRRLRYDHLVVADASGRTLPAHLSVPDPHRVRIAVEDAGAAYPVVIDPILTETADTTLFSGGCCVSFDAVSSAGDVNGDGYDDVLVGALTYDAGETNEGAVFVFLGSASGVADGDPSTAAAQLESDQQNAFLGAAAGAGDVNDDGYDDVIVGTGSYSAGETAEGAAFVFLGSASGIADGDPSTAAAQLESDQANAGSTGLGVAGAGDVNGDGYDDVIVGVSGYDAGESYEGAAFVFLGSASGIADGDPSTAATQLESDQDFARLGYSVAGAGDVNGDGYDDVIVGAPTAGAYQDGAAYVFLGSASGIPDGDPGTANAQLESDQVDVYFGLNVASAGDVNRDDYSDVIVGSTRYDAGEQDEGAAFVFLGGASGIGDGGPGTAAAQLESDQEFAEFGRVAGAGDVNGDGYDDVIVGANRYSAGEATEGAAFVFLGSAMGIASGGPGSAAAQLESDQEYAFLGSTVAGAGDVNGDGAADVIVGGIIGSSGEAAFVYHGEPDNDGDGILALTDNCLSRANPSQIDSDSDGFGNHCDADFNQNGSSESTDFGVFKNCYLQAVPGSGPPADPTCAESDMNGSLSVESVDFGLFKLEYLTPPGP